MIPGGTRRRAAPQVARVGLKIGSFIDDKLKISDNLAGVTTEKLDEHYRGVGGVERQKTRGAAASRMPRSAERNDPNRVLHRDVAPGSGQGQAEGGRAPRRAGGALPALAR
jgi:hypothetical protein